MAIDATKYKTVRQTIDQALDSEGWSRDFEFKGSCMFSQNKGDPTVDVASRINVVERIVSATVSGSNRRAVPTIAWNTSGSDTDNHLELLHVAIADSLRRKPQDKSMGKDVCIVFVDDKDQISSSRVSSVVKESVKSKDYFLVEDAIEVSSSCASPGLMLADVLAYLGMWIYAYHRSGRAEPTLFDHQEEPLGPSVIRKVEAVQAVLEAGSDRVFLPELPT